MKLLWVLIGGFILMQVMSKAFDGGDMMDAITKYDNVLEYQSRDGYSGGQSAGKGYNRYDETRYDYVPRRSERTGRYMSR